MKMKACFLFFVALFFVSSCKISEPDFNGIDNVKLDHIENRDVFFNLDANITNPNSFGMKAVKSDLDVYLDEQMIGKLFLVKKVKVKAKHDGVVSVPVKLSLEDGAMFTLLRYAGKENIPLQIKGILKGGVFIFTKKFKVNETRNVSGKIFKNLSSR